MKTFACIAAFTILLSFFACEAPALKTDFTASWQGVPARTWAGADFWANRLQDWQVANGRLECIADKPNLRMRTVHLVSRRIKAGDGEVLVTVKTGALHDGSAPTAAAGFLIGAGPTLDVMGAALVQQLPGPGAGIFVGKNDEGKLFIRDFEADEVLAESKTARASETETRLSLYINCQVGNCTIQLSDGEKQNLSHSIPANSLTGNIALVSHTGEGETVGRYWFDEWALTGSKVKLTETTAGPIIGSQYTLSEGVVKLTAQLAPISKEDPHKAFLEVNRKGIWEEIAQAEVEEPSYTAGFRVVDWDDTQDVPYRVRYAYTGTIGRSLTAFHEGIFRKDPKEKETIVVAGFTGNHMVASPGLSRAKGTFSYDSSGIWFPHTQLVDHVEKQAPDVLFFSGDQVYEGASPTFPDKEHYQLDYLYKWYLFLITYRDLMREIPSISIPDDHDVYQGNLWGGGGPLTDLDTKGGYVHPAWFVKMVERTQTSHLPDPYDPTPIEQGIGVYYTDMTYGEIGFAILEDRKFKSGCYGLPFQTRGRPDHIIDPNFNMDRADVPGLKLLGDRQLAFLDAWGLDWRGQQMKMALSQTIFANMATHHGGNLFRLIADLDSNGWPQTGRNKALDALRKAFAFHLAGDQHLASIVHHGVDTWNDGPWSFCVPSAANFYPRAWFPEAEGKNRPEGAPTNLGEHRDGLANPVTVYAVTNPTSFTKKSTGVEPLNLHDRMPGYGIVRMNKTNRTITMECWPRYSDPADANAKQYEGWPKTISMEDNYAREATGRLPEIRVSGMEDPVIQVVQESTGEVVYTLRIKGNTYQPKVFAEGTYTVKVGEPGTDQYRELTGLEAGKDQVLEVNF